MFKALLEVKIYILLICISCLFLLVREQVGVTILGTYFLASVFGVKTISCLITGMCYQEVYYFLIFYALLNFMSVFYYKELKDVFPNILQNINKNKNKNKNYL